ncbi:MAG: hypothetical protein MI861_01285, partial [Pirellulales bacterium]|nr:hypothetical protein [Pirellulales bacterium]
LSRTTDQRQAAALATLRSARLWGGLTSSGTELQGFGSFAEPSARYMGFLLEVFPKYFPEHGLKAINVELVQGNDKSRAASIWLLHTALEGSPDGKGKFVIRGVRFDRDWPATLDRPENGDSLLETTLMNLESALAEMGTDPPYERARTLGEETALRIGLLTRPSIAGEEWLESIVKAKLRETASKLDAGQRHQPGQFVGGALPLASEETLVAAIQMFQAWKLDLDWDVIAQAIMSPGYYRKSDRSQQVIDALVKQAPEKLTAAIEKRLQSHRKKSPTGEVYVGVERGSFDGKRRSTAVELTWAWTIWPSALQVYAEHAEDSAAALALLKSLRQIASEGSQQADVLGGAYGEGNSYEHLDLAIQKLTARVAEASKQETSD